MPAVTLPAWRARMTGFRPCFFEWLAWSQILLFQIFLSVRGFHLGAAPLVRSFVSVGLIFVAQVAIGILIRIMLARWWGQSALRPPLLDPGWWFMTARIGVASVLVVYVYSWLKLLVPYLHPVSYDLALWEMDRRLFAGHSPNVFFLDLFSAPSLLNTIDFLYSNAFLATLFFAVCIFITLPTEGPRVAYVNGSSALWIAGAWLYVAFPSLGPCYRFQDVWNGVRELIPHTQALQARLMHNYQLVLRLAQHPELTPQVNILLGIGAFPSLHVAFETYVTLWARKVARPLAPLFLFASVVVFIGSVVTGWHYLIDSVAGVVMALVAYGAAVRLSGQRH
jgi:hypothetical protein